MAEELTDATEEWFIHRGIPHFINEYNAAEDVFTRSLPVLSIFFLAEVVVAADTDWTFGQNVLALMGGFALMLVGYVLVNRWRSRQLFRRPDSVGLPELATFVLLPALLPLLIGGRLRGALLTLGFNALVLLMVYLVLGFGLLPMARWAVWHTFSQLGGMVRLMARSLPLVLVFSMFIFLNAELWQVADDFTWGYFALSVGTLGFVGSLFVLLRLPKEVEALRSFDTWDEVCEALSDSPLDRHHAQGLTGRPEPPPLTKPDWFNVGLIWVFSQGVQVVVVGFAVGLFYLVFGLFTVRYATVAQWTANDTIDVWFGSESGILLSRELVKVSGFIAAFSSLQFAVSAVTDDSYREAFLGDLISEVRESFAVRVLYLARLGVSASGPVNVEDDPPA